jgi:TRAP-type C4-dicarboxylate transport system permease small subunit
VGENVVARWPSEVERFTRVVSRITGVGIVIGAAFLVGAMLLMTANIAFRFFGGVVPGTYELVGPFISVTAAFALGYTALKQGHVVMDMVFRRLPQRTQVIVQSFTVVLSLGFCALLTWRSAELMVKKLLLREETSWLKVPLFPFRSFWELGLLLFCLVLLADLLTTLRRRASK